MKSSLVKTLAGLMSSLVVVSVFAAAPTQTVTIIKSGTENITHDVVEADILAGYSDADGDPLVSIQIVNLPTPNATLKLSGVDVTLSQQIANADLVNLTLVPTTDYVGFAAFDFTSSDGTAFSTPQSSYIVNFAVNPNNAPVYNGGLTDQTGQVGHAVTDYTFANNLFTDADGDALTYSASNVPAGLTFTPATRTFSGTPTAAGTTTVTVTANDGNGGTATGTFDYVISPNNPPIYNGGLTNQTGTVGTAVTDYTFANNLFTDADGDALTYSAAPIPAGLSFTAGTRTFAGTPTAAGTTTVTVTANDGNGGTATGTFDYVINSVPTVANPIADQTINVGDAITAINCTATFNDADGDAMTYTAQVAGGGALPAWLTFVAAPCGFTGTSTGVEVVNVELIANDGKGGTVTDSFTISVNAPGNNAPVYAGGLVNQTGTVGIAVTDYTFANNLFTDIDGDALTYSASNLPGGLTFTPATRTFSGTPTMAGTTTVTVTANDGNGGSANGTFDYVISAPNNVPTVATPIADQAINVGDAITAINCTATFNDADGDAMTYTAQVAGGGALPAWLTFVAAPCGFTGTSTGAEVVNVELTANDGNGGTVTDAFTITVSTPGNNAPVVNNPLVDQAGTVGTAFSYTFAADTFTDADADALTYTVDTTPAGITFDAVNRNFSGTPTTVQTVTITVTANDGNGGIITDDFIATISAAPSSGGGGGGGGGGGISTPSGPYQLVCPSSQTSVSTLYQALDLAGTGGEICKPINHENQYHKHRVFFPAGTFVTQCADSTPFEDILYVTKSVSIGTSGITISEGKQIIRIVDLSTQDDLCFSGGTLPDLTIRLYEDTPLNSLTVYVNDPTTGTLRPIQGSITIDEANNEITFPVDQTGRYVVAYTPTSGSTPVVITEKEVTPEPEPVPEVCLSDIVGHKFETEIRELFGQGVVDCKETFRPNDPVTRAETVKLALIAFGLTGAPVDNIFYPDVAEDQWFYDYVIRASELGIVHGYPHDGYYRPNWSVKRSEALKIVLLTSKFEELAEVNNFVDVNERDWFYYYTNFPHLHSVFETLNTTFDAAKYVTRAELAAMIARTQEAIITIGEKESIPNLETFVGVSEAKVLDTLTYGVVPKDLDGNHIKQSGVPLWCQFSLDNKEWHFFGTQVFTDELGVARCNVTLTKPTTTYFRGYRHGLVNEDLNSVRVDWKY